MDSANEDREVMEVRRRYEEMRSRVSRMMRTEREDVVSATDEDEGC